MDGAFVRQFEIGPTLPGSLDGLSFAVKDVFDVAGMVTGCGNPAWAATYPPAAVHAVAVEVLLASGARCVGKTVTDEFAFSLVGENHFYGTPRNGRAPDRVPGGSSSGSASAVSQGLADFALGTDTAGSIRVPAANCGLYSLRPTWGRISTAGVQALAPSFDTVGILARDAEVLSRVGDCFWPGEVEAEDIRTLYVVPEFWALADEEVRTVMEEETVRLAKAGLRVETISLGTLGDGALAQNVFAWKEAFSRAQWPEVWSTFGTWLSEAEREVGPKIAGNFALARKADRTQIAVATRVRQGVRDKLRRFLKSGAAILLPTVPCPPPLLGQVDYDRTGQGYLPRTLCLTAIANLGGLPQVTIPLSTAAGLPMGLSLIGAAGMDRELLRFAKGWR